MKILVPLILLISFACSEEEVKPSCSCEQMKELSSQAYDAWQLIYENKPVVGTLAQVNQWQIENEAAKGVYLKAESWIGNNCYDHETGTDF